MAFAGVDHMQIVSNCHSFAESVSSDSREFLSPVVSDFALIRIDQESGGRGAPCLFLHLRFTVLVVHESLPNEVSVNRANKHTIERHTAGISNILGACD